MLYSFGIVLEKYGIGTVNKKDTEMEKILYCMHVGWNWIKQRPHYLAEELSNYYYVSVISDYNYRGGTKNKGGNRESLEIHNFYKIPKIDHIASLSFINMLLRKMYYRVNIIKLKPEYIYVMAPTAINCIPNKCECKIIYDCMDDMLEFTDNKKNNLLILNDERELVQKANIIFTSSDNLRNVLLKRYGNQIKDKITVVRNGFSGKILSTNSVTRIEKNTTYKLCYFGTIAAWINFDYILRSLDEIDNLEYYLIGPLQSGMIIPSHDRLHHIPQVPHDELYQHVKNMDAFVMPFMVNKLIESVDPVKLYEYINYNKNILCVKYDEVNRFKEFVYFYNDFDQYINQIKNMMNSTTIKYSNEERVEFLTDNTWHNRADAIRKTIINL